MKQVFYFVELLLKLSTESGDGGIAQNLMPVFIGGSELVVASALSKWNVPVKYGSVLPGKYLSREIIEEIEAKGIDPLVIHLPGNRIGINRELIRRIPKLSGQ